MRRLRVLRAWPLALLTTLLLVIGSAGAARACEISNNSDVPVTIWFDCGIHCGNYFDLAKNGGTIARGGKGGYVAIGAVLPGKPPWSNGWYCERHGDPPFYPHQNMAHVDPGGEAIADIKDPLNFGAPSWNDQGPSASWTILDKDNNITTTGTFLQEVLTNCDWGTP